jgi:hypothetical protein
MRELTFGRVIVRGVLGVVLLVFGTATGVTAVVDQSNLPQWDGAWVAMSWSGTQTFQPAMPTLTGADIDIVTANPLLGDSIITMEVVHDGQVLAKKSQSVAVGFSGLLHFDFPNPVAINVGQTYALRVPGTKDTFGWKYGRNTYSRGMRLLGEKPEPQQDWFFQTYGGVSPSTHVPYDPRLQKEEGQAPRKGVPLLRRRYLTRAAACCGTSSCRSRH